MIRDSKSNYYTKFTNLAKEKNDPSPYFKVINRLKDRQSPRRFSVSDLFKNDTADFFTVISNGFTPIDASPVSYTHLTLPTTPYV